MYPAVLNSRVLNSRVLNSRVLNSRLKFEKHKFYLLYMFSGDFAIERCALCERCESVELKHKIKMEMF